MSFINWTSDEDGILIDFVRAHEILYNVKHIGYRQTLTKQKLWCEIGEILNKTNTDCNKRWCYVRDYYIRRKGKPGPQGEAARKRADRLSFLDSIPSSQRNTITYVKIENLRDDTENSSEPTPFQNEETEEITFNNEGDVSSDMHHDNDKGDSNNDDNINIFFEEDENMKRNLKRKNNSHAQERLNHLKQKVNKSTSPHTELDETDLFFSSMAKIVKKLPRYEQAKIRMQIGSLVGNAELRYISNDSPSTNVPMIKAQHKW